jgi:Leucine-rich repeat (LRR) protein
LLRDLDLARNKFGSLPSEIGNLFVLRTFALSNNVIQGSIPSEIGNLVNLLSLDFGNNLIRGSIPTEFGNLLSIRGT